ncbi:ankyrin repeat domain-containing protein [Aspergillus lucknowensis]|uniref:Ankyrin repeat-containing domain protein n=1 Tax=Aspergillus lucknowensis TaxID=176173 RepID=A0ABR4LTI5_9EURO
MGCAVLPFDIQYLILDELSSLDEYFSPSDWRPLVEMFCVCRQWYSSLQQLLAQNNRASNLLHASRVVGRVALEKLVADYAAREKAIELAEDDSSPLDWMPVTYAAREVPRYPDEDPLLKDLEYSVRVAAYRGYVDCVRIVLDSGFDYEYYSSYILYAAIEGEQIPVLEFIFDGKYIDIACEMDDGSALGTAVLQEKVPLVEFLLKRGADANIRVNYFVTNFEHSLSLVSYAAFKDNLELLRVLLSHGADLEDPEYYHRPIWWPIRCDNKPMVRVFIEKGVNLRTPSEGDSALYSAVRCGQPGMVKLLLDEGGLPEDAEELQELYDEIKRQGDKEVVSTYSA